MENRVRQNLVMLAAIALITIGASASASGWPDLRASVTPIGGGQDDAALIIAIEDYAFVEDVPGARANGEDWYHWLVEGRGVPAHSIRLLRNNEGTNHQILRDAARVAEAVGEAATLWVVFIGHGAPSADGEDGLLIGVDAQQTAIGLQSRGIPRSALLDALNQGRQARTVVVLDACFSGKTVSGDILVPGLQPLVPTFAARSTSATILSATRSDQFAGSVPGLGRPAFSYLLLGALQGWGDSNGDGLVTAVEAMAYTEGVLFALLTDRRQTPELTGPGGNEGIGGGINPGPDIAEFVLAEPGEPQPAIELEPDAGIGLPSIEVGAGAFWMGSSVSERDREDDESRHRVAITVPYAIGATEVPQVLYNGVMGDNPSRFKGESRPVESVSWLDAVQFCNELSRRDGLAPAYRIVDTEVNWDRSAGGYRLPTEAEWEYAARAGTGLPYAGSEDHHEVAWTSDNASDTTYPVASLAPNPWGLHDMSGNVAEWTWDWYGVYSLDDAIDPSGPEHGSIRVVRGGSFDYQPDAARAARRNGRDPHQATEFIGFRIVRTLP